VTEQTKAALTDETGRRIRRLRGKLGLTQVQFAELMGVSFASVNRWENGQSRPSALAWQRILAAEEHGLDALIRQEGMPGHASTDGGATAAGVMRTGRPT